MVSGIIHRIIRACSSWKNVNESITKAKDILRNNQYPPSYFEPIIKKTLNTVISPSEAAENEDEKEKEECKMLFIQYRGKVSEKFELALKKINAPCKIIYTIRKIKTVLPTLKSVVSKSLKSGIVYQITCSRCQSCYVGQTSRHLQTRIREHANPSTTVGSHMFQWNVNLSMDDVTIIATSRSTYHLLILEALWIKDIKPSLNTKDEFRSHALTIKI